MTYEIRPVVHRLGHNVFWNATYQPIYIIKSIRLNIVLSTFLRGMLKYFRIRLVKWLASAERNQFKLTLITFYKVYREDVKIKFKKRNKLRFIFANRHYFHRMSYELIQLMNFHGVVRYKPRFKLGSGKFWYKEFKSVFFFLGRKSIHSQKFLGPKINIEKKLINTGIEREYDNILRKTTPLKLRLKKFLYIPNYQFMFKFYFRFYFYLFYLKYSLHNDIKNIKFLNYTKWIHDFVKEYSNIENSKNKLKGLYSKFDNMNRGYFTFRKGVGKQYTFFPINFFFGVNFGWKKYGNVGTFEPSLHFNYSYNITPWSFLFTKGLYYNHSFKKIFRRFFIGKTNKSVERTRTMNKLVKYYIFQKEKNIKVDKFSRKHFFLNFRVLRKLIINNSNNLKIYLNLLTNLNCNKQVITKKKTKIKTQFYNISKFNNNLLRKIFDNKFFFSKKENEFISKYKKYKYKSIYLNIKSKRFFKPVYYQKITKQNLNGKKILYNFKKNKFHFIFNFLNYNLLSTYYSKFDKKKLNIKLDNRFNYWKSSINNKKLKKISTINSLIEDNFGSKFYNQLLILFNPIYYKNFFIEKPIKEKFKFIKFFQNNISKHNLLIEKNNFKLNYIIKLLNLTILYRLFFKKIVFFNKLDLLILFLKNIWFIKIYKYYLKYRFTKFNIERLLTLNKINPFITEKKKLNYNIYNKVEKQFMLPFEDYNLLNKNFNSFDNINYGNNLFFLSYIYSNLMFIFKFGFKFLFPSNLIFKNKYKLYKLHNYQRKLKKFVFFYNYNKKSQQWNLDYQERKILIGALNNSNLVKNKKKKDIDNQFYLNNKLDLQIKLNLYNYLSFKVYKNKNFNLIYKNKFLLLNSCFETVNEHNLNILNLFLINRNLNFNSLYLINKHNKILKFLNKKSNLFKYNFFFHNIIVLKNILILNNFLILIKKLKRSTTVFKNYLNIKIINFFLLQTSLIKYIVKYLISVREFKKWRRKIANLFKNFNALKTHKKFQYRLPELIKRVKSFNYFLKKTNRRFFHLGYLQNFNNKNSVLKTSFKLLKNSKLKSVNNNLELKNFPKSIRNLSYWSKKNTISLKRYTKNFKKSIIEINKYLNSNMYQKYITSAKYFNWCRQNNVVRDKIKKDDKKYYIKNNNFFKKQYLNSRNKYRRKKWNPLDNPYNKVKMQLLSKRIKNVFKVFNYSKFRLIKWKHLFYQPVLPYYKKWNYSLRLSTRIFKKRKRLYAISKRYLRSNTVNETRFYKKQYYNNFFVFNPIVKNPSKRIIPGQVRRVFRKILNINSFFNSNITNYKILKSKFYKIIFYYLKLKFFLFSNIKQKFLSDNIKNRWEGQIRLWNIMKLKKNNLVQAKFMKLKKNLYLSKFYGKSVDAKKFKRRGAKTIIVIEFPLDWRRKVDKSLHDSLFLKNLYFFSKRTSRFFNKYQRKTFVTKRKNSLLSLKKFINVRDLIYQKLQEKQNFNYSILKDYINNKLKSKLKDNNTINNNFKSLNLIKINLHKLKIIEFQISKISLVNNSYILKDHFNFLRNRLVNKITSKIIKLNKNKKINNLFFRKRNILKFKKKYFLKKLKNKNLLNKIILRTKVIKNKELSNILKKKRNILKKSTDFIDTCLLKFINFMKKLSLLNIFTKNLKFSIKDYKNRALSENNSNNFKPIFKKPTEEDLTSNFIGFLRLNLNKLFNIFLMYDDNIDYYSLNNFSIFHHYILLNFFKNTRNLSKIIISDKLPKILLKLKYLTLIKVLLNKDLFFYISEKNINYNKSINYNKNYFLNLLTKHYYFLFSIIKKIYKKKNINYYKQNYSARKWLKYLLFNFWLEQYLEKVFSFNVKLNHFNVLLAYTKLYRLGINIFFNFTKTISSYRRFGGFRQQTIYIDIIWIVLISLKYFSSTMLVNMIAEQILKRKDHWPFLKRLRWSIRDMMPYSLLNDPEQIHGIRIWINGKINGKDRAVSYMMYKFYKDYQISTLRSIYVKADYSMTYSPSWYGVFGIKAVITRI